MKTTISKNGMGNQHKKEIAKKYPSSAQTSPKKLQSSSERY